MSSAAIVYGELPADPRPAANDAGLEQAPQDESLFTVFVDEIDAWARHALAANGFGDAP